VQLGMVLERYSDGIIDYATNPISGIQRVSKWPPSIAEVVSHCDAEVERLDKIRRYRELGTAQDRLARTPQEPIAFGEMVAKYGRPVGPFERGTAYEQYAGRRTEMARATEFKRMNAEDLERIYGGSR
jgi:hypothetical protein